MAAAERAALVLDGASLTIAELARVARDPRVRIECAPAALARVERGAAQVAAIVDRYRRRPESRDYGVTTGFGEFKKAIIPAERIDDLQRNILLSHLVGVGNSSDPDDPGNYFAAEIVRAALVTRLNTFLGGHSGVRPELVVAVVAMIERGVVPLVPLHGSLGSSGDLCPLSHLFAVLLGEGRYYRVETTADLAGGRWRERELRDASRLAGDLEGTLLEPPERRVTAKEGLALTNGATFSAAALALATHDAEALAGTADAAAALSLEAICGCARAFDPKVHDLRGQRGQIASAANLRRLLEGSRLIDRRATEVQDAYSLRCAPVVHGASREAVAFAKMIVGRELNAATDNPLFFPEEEERRELVAERWDGRFAANWPAGYDGRERRSYSAGNFHGQQVALAADFLTIAVAELANISERRTQTLLDRNHNRGLPPNLIPDGGVNSGYMLAQYCAASLVSENKVLAHPVSVDSIPTSANTEDHVAMAAAAARKLGRVLANAQAVLAIELMVAAQAVEWRAAATPAIWEELGVAAAPGEGEEERRFLALTGPDAGELARRRAALAERLGAGSGRVYLAVRAAAPAMREDRPLDADLGRLRRLLETGELVAGLAGELSGALEPIAPLS